MAEFQYIFFLLLFNYHLNCEQRKYGPKSNRHWLHLQILKYCDFLENYSPKAEIFSIQKGLTFTKLYFILTEMTYVKHTNSYHEVAIQLKYIL